MIRNTTPTYRPQDWIVWDVKPEGDQMAVTLVNRLGQFVTIPLENYDLGPQTPPTARLALSSRRPTPAPYRQVPTLLEAN